MLGAPPRFVARGHRRHRQRHRVRDDDGGRADPEGRRRARHAARFASRSGAARNRDCSDRRPTSPSTSAPPKRRSRSSRSSPATSTSTAGPAACAALTVFGPPEAAAVLREAVAPFADLGVVGAIATHSRRRGGTDSTSFNAAGPAGHRHDAGSDRVPQRHLAHEPRHLRADRRRRRARRRRSWWRRPCIALAMRDEPLPRFTKDEMPKPEPPAQPGPSAPTAPTAPSAPSAPSAPLSR